MLLTLRYELMTAAGLVEVTGEYVSLSNVADAAFGAHANPRLPDGHPDKWTVTHLASGLMVGTGVTRSAAISQATTNLARQWADLPRLLSDAIKAREVWQVAASRLRQHAQTLLTEAAA